MPYSSCRERCAVSALDGVRVVGDLGGSVRGSLSLGRRRRLRFDLRSCLCLQRGFGVQRKSTHGRV